MPFFQLKFILNVKTEKKEKTSLLGFFRKLAFPFNLKSKTRLGTKIVLTILLLFTRNQTFEFNQIEL